MTEEEVFENRTRVVRDHTFARAVADGAVVVNLGRDVELSFLQEGQQPEYRTSGDEGEGTVSFNMEPILTEVCRVRMAPGASVVLALSILHEVSPTGRLKKDKLKNAFEQILAEIPESDMEASDS